MTSSNDNDENSRDPKDPSSPDDSSETTEAAIGEILPWEEGITLKLFGRKYGIRSESHELILKVASLVISYAQKIGKPTSESEGHVRDVLVRTAFGLARDLIDVQAERDAFKANQESMEQRLEELLALLDETLQKLSSP
jgi:cell division protein ZapA (FtsZ GTPase activity inhibitor)